jgi:hypothetical protein
MWVDTYHYQAQIALPTQKLMSYPTQKLITHMLPYPKYHPKSHNSHTTLPNHTCKMMSSPSKVVAWECGACAYTNKDATQRICLACQARCLVCYAIVAGAAVATTARTTRVDCCKQACIAALATAAPPVAGEVATSAYPEWHLLPPMGHLLLWRVWPCTPGRLPNLGKIVQALLLAWSIQWLT